GSFLSLGSLTVRGPPIGRHGFKALVGHYSSDASYRDAGDRAEFFGPLRRRCLEAQAAARLHVSCCSLRVMAAYDDSCPDGRVIITQVVTLRRRRLPTYCTGAPDSVVRSTNLIRPRLKVFYRAR